MKRSEMVQNIARSLMSHLDMDKKERMELADSLLGDIEIEGMLPPERCDEPYYYCDGTGLTGDRVRHDWEKEDNEPKQKAPKNWKYEGSSI